MTRKAYPQNRRMRGFEAAAGLLRERIRVAAEGRGFAVARLLTHWAEIAGDETARHARPVKIGYARDGIGATLTLLVSGAAAPMLQMQLPRLKERVNACYGYNAVSRIVITQSAPTGFAEGQAAFAPAPMLVADAGFRREAAQAACAVTDDGLRSALALLGENVLNRSRTRSPNLTEAPAMTRPTMTAALVAIAAAGGWTLATGDDPVNRLASPVAAQTTDTAASPAAVDPAMIADMRLGNPDASVTVVEYASFTCPHCADFNDTVFRDIKTNYIDTGKINFVYREVYFDRYGLWAGMIARCGGEMRYFGIADIIYSTQREWAVGNDPAVIVDNLRKIGRTAGMTDDQMNTCLNNAAVAEALVGNFQKNAEADGIDSTPSFVINGEKYSNMSYDEFVEILDAKLAE